ncbi:MAG: hypothetical protein MZW92_36325 [Comamonadaceae bacterium]|nr:hypothetical protein [Comamonadaceae bacterium]
MKQLLFRTFAIVAVAFAATVSMASVAFAASSQGVLPDNVLAAQLVKTRSLDSKGVVTYSTCEVLKRGDITEKQCNVQSRQLTPLKRPRCAPSASPVRQRLPAHAGLGAQRRGRATQLRDGPWLSGTCKGQQPSLVDVAVGDDGRLSLKHNYFQLALFGARCFLFGRGPAHTLHRSPTPPQAPMSNPNSAEAANPSRRNSFAARLGRQKSLTIH